ncbi:MAG: hypothetical protein RSC29_07525, partial [Oscillospiraceae bacterium]
GYYAGYIKTASTLGILNGVNISPGNPVTKRMAAQMLENSLFVDKMEYVGSVDGQYKYIATPGKTLLRENLHLEIVKVTITGVENTGLIQAKNISKNEIELDGEKFPLTYLEAKKYLGYNVEAYRKLNDEKSVVFVSPLSEDKIIEINAEDIYEIVDADSQKYKVSYDNKNLQMRTEDIFKSSYVIINGLATVGYTEKDLLPEQGSVKIVDFNGDGKSDIVYITSEKVMVVDSVDLINKTIYGKRNAKVEIDNQFAKVSITKGITSVGLGEIGEWDVLTIVESKEENNVKIVDIIVSNVDKLEGYISDTYKDSIKIDGIDYKISKFAVKTPNAGDYSTFYFDNAGRYVGQAPVVGGGVMKFAILIQYINTGGLDNNI